jgi:hypothetical protein
VDPTVARVHRRRAALYPAPVTSGESADWSALVPTLNQIAQALVVIAQKLDEQRPPEKRSTLRLSK